MRNFFINKLRCLCLEKASQAKLQKDYFYFELKSNNIEGFTSSALAIKIILSKDILTFPFSSLLIYSLVRLVSKAVESAIAVGKSLFL